MARKETLATPCIFLRERLLRRTKTLTSQETFCLFGVQRAATHSLSSSYMGRMEGWHTKAKVRMGTA